MDRRIFHVLETINSELGRAWTLTELAENVGLSGPHLMRLFKQQTGNTPVGYIREMRLNAARSLLDSTFLQIKEVCHEVGYSSESRFSRDCKLHFGLTPTEYRKSIEPQGAPKSQIDQE